MHMALAGDHIVVIMDDSGGTPRTFADGDIKSVDLGLTYAQHDVSGFGQAAQNFINGQMQAPVTVKGYLTTTADIGTHPVINGAYAAGSQVTLTVQVGQNAAPTTGDPEFEGEFVVESYKPEIQAGGAIGFAATLKPATGTAPAWGTMS
jgi:hypothetical protein